MDRSQSASSKSKALDSFAAEHPAVLQNKLQTLEQFIDQWESAIERFSTRSYSDSIFYPTADRGKLLRQIKERLGEMYATIQPAPSLVQSDVANQMGSSDIAAVVGRDIVQAMSHFEQSIRVHDSPGADRLAAYADEFVKLVSATLDTALIPARNVRERLTISLRPYGGRKKTERQIAQEQRNDALKKLSRLHGEYRPARLLELSKSDPILREKSPLLPVLTKEIIRKVIRVRATRKLKNTKSNGQ